MLHENLIEKSSESSVCQHTPRCVRQSGRFSSVRVINFFFSGQKVFQLGLSFPPWIRLVHSHEPVAFTKIISFKTEDETGLVIHSSCLEGCRIESAESMATRSASNRIPGQSVFVPLI